MLKSIVNLRCFFLLPIVICLILEAKKKKQRTLHGTLSQFMVEV